MKGTKDNTYSIEQINLHIIGNRLRGETLTIPRDTDFSEQELADFLECCAGRIAEKGAPFVCSDEMMNRLRHLLNPTEFDATCALLSKQLYEAVTDLRMPLLSVLYTRLNIEWKGTETSCILIAAYTACTRVLETTCRNTKAAMKLSKGACEENITKGIFCIPEKNECYILSDISCRHFWVNEFCGAKPLLTEKLKGNFATHVVRKVSKKISSTEANDRFRDNISEIIKTSDGFSESDLAACCCRFISHDEYNAIKSNTEEKLECKIPPDSSIGTSVLEKRLGRFIKSIRLSPDMAITISGKREIAAVERLSEDAEAGTYVIKLTLNK